MRWLAALPLLGGCQLDRLECADRPAASLDIPDDLVGYELKKVDPDRSQVAWGHLTLAHFNRDFSWAAVMDGCAQYSWWRQAPQRFKFTRIRMGRDRSSLLMSQYHRSRAGGPGTITRVSLTGGEDVITVAEEHHHDFVELDNQQVAWLGWEYTDNIWFPDTAEWLASDAIRVAPEGWEQKHAEVVFSLMNDTGREPWRTCEHMDTDGFKPGAIEWSHSNSLVWEPVDQAWYIMVRHWDALLKISAEGELLWTLGGPHNEFKPLGDTQLFRHAHMSEAWPGGVLVFDNANHGTERSRAVQYAIDEDARTVREVWAEPAPHDGFISYLGDVTRLSGGNRLVVWSALGRIVELTPDGDVVWEARGPYSIGRVGFVDDWPGVSR